MDHSQRSPDAPQRSGSGFQQVTGLRGAGFPARVTGERDFRPGARFPQISESPASRKQFQDSPNLSKKLWIIHREAQMPCRGSGSGFQQVTGLRGAGFPAGSPGSGIFDRELAFPKFQNLPSLSKKLWIAGSLHREGRRSPDAPRGLGSGYQRVIGISRAAPRHRRAAGFLLLAGSPGSGIFDRVPRRGYWSAEFSLRRGRGKRVFPALRSRAGSRFFPEFRSFQARRPAGARCRHFPLPGSGIPLPGSPRAGFLRVQ